jgi:hypothetical protein
MLNYKVKLQYYNCMVRRFWLLHDRSSDYRLPDDSLQLPKLKLIAVATIRFARWRLCFCAVYSIICLPIILIHVRIFARYHCFFSSLLTCYDREQVCVTL